MIRISTSHTDERTVSVKFDKDCTCEYRWNLPDPWEVIACATASSCRLAMCRMCLLTNEAAQYHLAVHCVILHLVNCEPKNECLQEDFARKHFSYKRCLVLRWPYQRNSFSNFRQSPMASPVKYVAPKPRSQRIIESGNPFLAPCGSLNPLSRYPY